MFTKSDQTAAPQATAPRPSNSKSVFASDLKITGEISAAGDIEMSGEVEGHVHARSLTVASEGKVTGTVTATTVDVRGKLNGQVTAGSFTLRAAAQVTTDATYSTLVIESGAQVEGRFGRHRG